MEKMMVVIFDSQPVAYKGVEAFADLNYEGSVSIHSEAVVAKAADGTLVLDKEIQGDFPIRTLSGTAVGALIGLIGGPVGSTIGALAGTFAGMMGDVAVSGVDAEFLDDVTKALIPGKSAVVLELSEDWESPVDTRMEALGGKVFRTPRENLERDHLARREATLRAQISVLKAEQSQAQADRKQRLQARIESLNNKLEATLQRRQQRLEQLKRETNAKVQALQASAAKAQGAAKDTLNMRAAQLREQFTRDTTGAAGRH